MLKQHSLALAAMMCAPLPWLVPEWPATMKLLPTAQDVIEAEMGQRGEFGAAVAVSSDLAAVAAPLAMVDRQPVGAVSIFRFESRSSRRAGEGSLRPWARRLGEIVPTDLSRGARFGAALAFGSDAHGRALLAIGAPGANSPGGEPVGLVRIYRVDAGHAGELHGGRSFECVSELHPPEGRVGASFGASLAMDADGQRLAVGAPLARAPGGIRFAGEVHVYRRDGHGWRFESTVRQERPGVAATFGKCLLWLQGPKERGPVLAVAAPGDGQVAPGAGVVLGYRESPSAAPKGGPWDLAWSLRPGPFAGGVAGARFGESLGSVGARTLAVGVPGRGRVELFDPSRSGRPSPLRAFSYPGSPGASGFGVALAGAPSGDRSGWLMVGAPHALGPGGRPGAGALYLYRRGVSGKWCDPLERHGQPTFNGEFGVSVGATSVSGGGVAWISGEPGSSLACSETQPTCGAGAAYGEIIAR